MGNKLSSVHSSWLLAKTEYDTFLNHRGEDVMRKNQFSVQHSWLSAKSEMMRINQSYSSVHSFRLLPKTGEFLNHRGANVMGMNQSFSSGLLTKVEPFLNHTGADVIGINQSSVHYSWLPTATRYDVFLNHRGADVKESVGSLIFHNLQNKGLKVFFDKNSIQAGENVPRSIEEAIHSASVHIVIFSSNYAESVWCLKELQLILKTGAPIIPVFYKVQPSELRMKNEEGLYARTFHKHTERFESHVLEEWKKSLCEVSYIKGYIFEG
ncbi:hypothetical protein SUGI_0247770 [Cryptomeria japonica]|nr:hypothetical protein SUGI_0247770 [Cryptomeria japonica]